MIGSVFVALFLFASFFATDMQTGERLDLFEDVHAAVSSLHLPRCL